MFSAPYQKINFESTEERLHSPVGHQKPKGDQSKSKGNIAISNVRYSNPSSRKKCIKAYHFSNAIYQGQMRAFHRTGKGLLLHDNGLTGIIRSGSNHLKDHCIFFGQNVLISVIYKVHEIEFVYKNGDSILVLNMQKKDKVITIKSPGYLVEIGYKRVFKLRFNNDVLVEKLALTYAQCDQIIEKEQFTKIMSEGHIEALKLNIFDSQFQQIDVIPKSHKELHIGFTQVTPKQYSTTYQASYAFDEAHDRHLHGLGFVIEKISHDATKQFQYEFRVLERGFYSRGMLQYFGELFYQNGNSYFGGIRNQQMHGNGILVYKDERRFVYGNFIDGKPVKLDQNKSYNLDTQEGRSIYLSLRKKLHSEDPQVWIDGQVFDLPSAEYFSKKLAECTNFRYEDEEIRKYQEKLVELNLSRKVQDFQKDPMYSRTISGGRLNNSYYNRNSSRHKYALTDGQYLSEAIRRQADEQELKKRIGQRFLTEQFQPVFTFSPSHRDVILNETPIRKIDKFTTEFNNTPLNPFQNNRANETALNNNCVNESIINSFGFLEKNSNPSTKKLSSQQELAKTLFQGRNHYEIDDNYAKYELASSRKRSQNQDNVNITISQPLQRGLISSVSRSLSRSQSRSLSRSLQKQIERSLPRQASRSREISQTQKGNLGQKINYLNPNADRETNYFKRSPAKKQKKSIIQKLYSDVNRRAQQLEREYQRLEFESKQRSSPLKSQSKYSTLVKQSLHLPPKYNQSQVSLARTDTNSQSRQVGTINSPKYTNLYQQDYDTKCMAAANEALKLANSNKIKEQKFLHYDHYTHKRRFDYTSESKEEELYKEKNAYQRQASQRTPEKNSRYDNWMNKDFQRTQRRQKVDSVTNRLYPHQPSQIQNKAITLLRPQKTYDSSYEQSRPLNVDGRSRKDDRTIQLQQKAPTGKYIYGSEFKNSVIRQNAVIWS